MFAVFRKPRALDCTPLGSRNFPSLTETRVINTCGLQLSKCFPADCSSCDGILDSREHHRLQKQADREQESPVAAGIAHAADT